MIMAGAAALAASPEIARAGPRVGKPAPGFKAVTFSGEKIDSKDLIGDVVVLNFWATWCVPCREELPLLNGYYKLRKDMGLVVLAIATEDSVPPDKLKPLQAVLTLPLVKRFSGPYDIIDGAVPSNFIIDRSGVLRYAKAAALDLDDMNERLVPLLNEPAAPPPPSKPPTAT
jgi:thiol-disulfide isomerase/thioredoxin